MNADDISFSSDRSNRKGVPDEFASSVDGSSLTAATIPDSSPEEIFDLKELGIDIVGTFNNNGDLVSWMINTNPIPMNYGSMLFAQPVIRLANDPTCSVYVRGIFSKKFTNDRRRAMGLSPL